MSKQWIRSVDNFVTSYIGKRGRSIFLVGSTLGGFLTVFDVKFAQIVEGADNPAGVKNIYKLWWMRMLYGRSRSRLTGMLLNKPIPIWMRIPLYKCFAFIYGCNLEEIRYPLESYKCLGHFFARTLQNEARVLEDTAITSMLSPCDSEVVSMGNIKEDTVEQIKGTSYSLSSFLGVDALDNANKKQKSLKYCVLYLAPGDYHHFHSPCLFSIAVRRHFSGELFPVSKSFIKYVNDVFSVNERVVMSGKWSGGDCHMAAVAAYNVGNIRLTVEPKFRSNQYRKQLWYLGGDIDINTNPAIVNKEIPVGQHLGEFRFGSTIVLVFEAEDDFEWDVKLGDKLKVGQRLGGSTPKCESQPKKHAYYAVDRETV